MPEPGQRLADRYRLGEVLGAGGMGVVMRAHDERLDRPVAVKLLRPRHAPAEEQTRLLREARALARLSHPHVVEVFEVCSPGPDALMFVVMELVEGGTLEDWLRRRAPGPGQILETLQQAGRGLAAAHAVGVIHRDFKPANVLVSESMGGVRVRVVDFGLARLDTETSIGSGSIASWPSGSDDSLTVSGVVMGTPVYMAPEQHAGLQVDARTDQYAFCAVLYEALAGARPFAGKSLAQLASDKLVGRLAPPVGHRRIPNRVARVIERGLSPDPDDRFEDMETLLHVLRLAGRPPRRWVASVGLLGAAVVVTTVSARDVLPCEDRVGAGGPAWDEGRAQRIHATITASPRYAPDSADKVVAALERFAAAWTHERSALCDLAPDVVASAAFDQRLRCLGAHKAHFEVLAESLELGQADAIAAATTAVAELPRPSECATEREEAPRLALPPDPETAARVGEVRTGLARLRGLEAAARHDEAVQDARDLVVRAREIGHEPLLAEANLALGRVLMNAGAHDEAVTVLEHATWQASSTGHHVVEMGAAGLLAFIEGYYRANKTEALRWDKHARAAWARAGEDGTRFASLVDNALGSILFRHGEIEAALRHFEAAETHARDHFGPEHPEVVDIMTNRGTVLAALGRYDEAQPVLERSHALAVALHGRNHPMVSNVLHSLGLVAFLQQRLEPARKMFVETLEIREAVFGPSHVELLAPLNNLGSVLEAMDDLDGARAPLERSVAVHDAVHPGHPDTAMPLNNLGRISLALGEPTQARRYHRRAYELTLAGYGAGHPDLAYALGGMGAAALSLGDLDAAVAHLEHAHEITEEAATRPADRANTQFNLAKALWRQGSDRGRSVAMAEQAVEAYAAAGPDFASEQREIEQWLAQRSARSVPRRLDANVQARGHDQP